MRAIFRIAGGIALIILGIIGIILPIMPGWIFLVPGLVIISEYYPPVKRLLDWAKTKLEKHKPGFFRKQQPPHEATDKTTEGQPS